MSNLENIEKNLGYKFLNDILLYSALCHPSSKNKQKTEHLNFEYLEFLGDRVLGLCVAQMLKKLEPIKEIARKHATLVSTQILAKIGHELEIEKHLQHEMQSVSKKVLADATEAIIGALFLDSNLAKAQEIIEKFWNPFLYTCKPEPKMQLQEFAQKGGELPVYEVINMQGTDNEKIYTIAVKITIDKKEFKGEGAGRSKQEASKNAAQNLLQQIGLIHERDAE